MVINIIGIFLGEQNSGKTLSMSYYANRYKRNGYRIFSNYNLKFKHKKLTKEIIENYTKSRKQFTKAVFCIDEIYLFFDSRNFGSKGNKIFSYFVTQSSKNDVHIFGTAQFFNTIEKRLRNNCTFKCFCNRYYKDIENNTFTPITKKVRFIENQNILYIKNSFLIKTISGLNETIRQINYFIRAKPIFKMFDTKELIQFD